VFNTTKLNLDISISITHFFLLIYTAPEVLLLCTEVSQQKRKMRWESKSWRSAKVTTVCGGRYTLQIVNVRATMNICTATACKLLCS
jgi:hypothetical protein